MPSFTCHGTWPPASPVVLSVPHAGRDYPPALLAAARVAPATLMLLEDRHVDAVAMAARGAATTLVQHVPRASIDLNRAEDERDPATDAGAGEVRSARVRSGLGLVPRRVGSAAALWRQRFSAVEVARRIATEYRPYHAALAEALAAARGRWGAAVLLDLHSMPPLPGPGRAEIVLGDRHGRTAPGRMVARLEAEAAADGLRTALNSPYAGGHLIDRHAAPHEGCYAIQVEISRALYLDAALERPGPGLNAVAAMVRRMIAALEDEILARSMPAAAE